MNKTLFIDYDGTLHNTDARYAENLDGVLELSSDQIIHAYLKVHREIVHLQYPEKHDDFLFHQRFLFKYLGRPYDEAEAVNAAKRFKAAQEECWTKPIFFPDTFQFLDSVKENNILCLTTGDFASEKAAAVEKSSGKHYFKYVFDHNDLGLKGGDSYFRNALTSTKARPEEAVAIGDSIEQDIARASEVGITTIWINRRDSHLAGESPGLDYEANNLIEALGYLQEL